MKFQLKRFLLALLVLTVVATAATAGISIWLDRAETRRIAEQRLLGLTELQENQTVAWIRMAELILSEMEEAAAGQPLGPNLNPRLKVIVGKSPDLESLWVVGPDGLSLASTVDLAAPLQLSDREFFIQAMAAPGTKVAPMIQGRRTGNWVVTIARRLENPDGTVRGVIGASIHAVRFNRHYETAMLNGPRGTHNVLHADGSLIFRSPMPSAEMEAGSLREPVARLTAPFGAAVTVSPIDGIERLVAWRHFGGFPLVTVAGAPLEEVYAEWWQRSRIMVAVALCWALALALLGAFAWRAIRREEEARALAIAGEARYTEALERERDRAVQARQDKAVLLNELHHRVKNNLQILSSLAMMQKLRAGALAPQLDSFTARIEAIAKVHEVLSHADEVEQIDFRAYAEALVRDLVRANGRDAIEVAVEGSGHLSLERATPLGIVLNELVTNILKYGFEGRDRGRISLDVRQTDAVFTLRLADDGVGAPIPTASPRKSLGLSLISNLLRQIDAEVEMESVPGRGTSWTITCPLTRPAAYLAESSPAAAD